MILSARASSMPGRVFSSALLALFSDRTALQASRDGVYQWAEHTRWPEFGACFAGLIADAAKVRNRLRLVQASLAVP